MIIALIVYGILDIKEGLCLPWPIYILELSTPVTLTIHNLNTLSKVLLTRLTVYAVVVFFNSDGLWPESSQHPH